MASHYSIAEARSQISAIIDKAEAGEAVQLTRRGRAVAVVVSCEMFERLQAGRPRFADAYRVFREQHALAEVGLDDDFAKTVRDRAPGRKVNL